MGVGGSIVNMLNAVNNEVGRSKVIPGCQKSELLVESVKRSVVAKRQKCRGSNAVRSSRCREELRRSARDVWFDESS
jgi:hypothetical protein